MPIPQAVENSWWYRAIQKVFNPQPEPPQPEVYDALAEMSRTGQANHGLEPKVMASNTHPGTPHPWTTECEEVGCTEITSEGDSEFRSHDRFGARR